VQNKSTEFGKERENMGRKRLMGTFDNISIELWNGSRTFTSELQLNTRAKPTHSTPQPWEGINYWYRRYCI